MEAPFQSETESLLKEQASLAGRKPEEIAEDVVSYYLADLVELRAELDWRWRAYQRGETTLIDGEEAFKSLRQRALDRQKQPVDK